MTLPYSTIIHIHITLLIPWIHIHTTHAVGILLVGYDSDSSYLAEELVSSKGAEPRYPGDFLRAAHNVRL